MILKQFFFHSEINLNFSTFKDIELPFFIHIKIFPINTISIYKTLVYDSVETNNGNGYDARSGKFTAPEIGLYMFHTNTTARDKSHSIIEVVKNGQVKDVSWADAMDHNERGMLYWSGWVFTI